MESNVVNSGVASQLVRLSELPGLPFNAKVRFLGCVMQYDRETGLLHLIEPAQTASESGKDGPQVVAGVDISMIDSKADQLTTGNWINVIGYIDGPKYKPLSMGDKMIHGIKIRAQSLWHAGTIDPDEYYKSVTGRKEAFD